MNILSINSYPQNLVKAPAFTSVKSPKNLKVPKEVKKIIQSGLNEVSSEDNFVKGVNKSDVTLGVKSVFGTNPVKSFDDIGGYDDVIEILTQDVIFPIKYPKAFPNKMPQRGIIFYGDSGCGKTTMAEAVAKEAGAHFIKVDGLELSPNWLENYEKNIQQIFFFFLKNQPSIIFLDNLDKFSDKIVRKSTKPQIVVMKDSEQAAENVIKNIEEENFIENLINHKIDEIERNGDNIFVIGASKDEKMLESTLVSSQRMQVLNLSNPNVDDLVEIFNIHSQNIKVSSELNVENVMTFMAQYGANGSDVASLLREALKQAYLRCGIFEKMSLGTFKQSDLRKVEISIKDIDNALNADFTPKIHLLEVKQEKPPIGFKFGADVEKQPQSVEQAIQDTVETSVNTNNELYVTKLS